MPLLTWRASSLVIVGGVFVSVVAYLHRRRRSNAKSNPLEDDPSLLKKHSSFQSYSVAETGFTYPQIRTFYRPHPQADKLPSKPTPLPLLVFIHGVGGSAAQFAPLLTALVNVGPCLCIDLPGCGLSEFAPLDWEAYSFDALAWLLCDIIKSHLDLEAGQGMVLLCHSMGCSLGAAIASKTSPQGGSLAKRVLAIVAICPRISPLTTKQVDQARKLLMIPTPIFDVWRQIDAIGDEQSRSVTRFVGTGADRETREMQLRFNRQSRTDVWRRMAWGIVNRSEREQGKTEDEVWAAVDCPVHLIAGDADTVTTADEARKIAKVLEASWGAQAIAGSTELRKQSSNPAEFPIEEDNFKGEKAAHDLKLSILPAPAAHALLFAPPTSRTVSGLVQAFLARHVDKRLSLGWQLQYLSTEGKWDVKNLAKWSKVSPMSKPIGGADVLRATKTMREVDDLHCPRVFVERWGSEVKAVIDVSHDSPVYDPRGLEEGGVEYHKFPTVSKLPPTIDEVKGFNDLVDKLRAKPTASGQSKSIAVHCHYGFNRTGFFIICYLVDRMGWSLKDAIDDFAKARPPGIKHDYFLDTLYVRYCVGMRKESISYPLGPPPRADSL